MVTRIGAIASRAGREAELRGWLYNKRSSGKILFLIVRDGTGFIQVVVSRAAVGDAVFALCDRLTQESSIIVRGTVRADQRAPGGYEVDAADVRLVHLAEEYPLSPKEHGVDFLMDHRHLWLRTPRQTAVMRLRAEIVAAIREYLDGQGFVAFDAPVLTPSAAEGTTNLFETDYFGDRAYLSQSGQLYAEAGAMALGRVYTFGPTFRAEKSKTRRHLTEFWMIEPEAAFVDFEENLRIQEELVCHVVGRVLERRRGELALLGRDTAPLERVAAPFPRMRYDEAVEWLRARGQPIRWGEDFGAPDETLLAEAHDRPLFITHFPAHMKAFYMMPDPADARYALAADLLAPEGYGEIIGGSQRIDDAALLERRLAEHNLPRAAYGWYLDLRRYGSVPHSGFGLGLERTLAWIGGLEHVRETIPFPRMLNRVYP